jgi:hypothetical protein
MRVLQGDDVGAVQADPAAATLADNISHDIVELGAKMRCGKYGSKDVLCKGGAAGRYAGISKRY